MKNDSNDTPVSDDILMERAKAALDDSLTQIDPEIRQCLQQARGDAVRTAAQAQQRPQYHQNRQWLISAGAALTLVVTVTFYYWTGFTGDQSPLASVEDMPLLTAPEELELYEELDFYQWLALENEGVG